MSEIIKHRTYLRIHKCLHIKCVFRRRFKGVFLILVPHMGFIKFKVSDEEIIKTMGGSAGISAA